MNAEDVPLTLSQDTIEKIEQKAIEHVVEVMQEYGSMTFKPVSETLEITKGSYKQLAITLEFCPFKTLIQFESEVQTSINCLSSELYDQVIKRLQSWFLGERSLAGLIGKCVIHAFHDAGVRNVTVAVGIWRVYNLRIECSGYQRNVA